MVIHIDTGKTWRGGQQQAFYLHQHLHSQGINSLMVCKRKSDMEKRCKEKGLPCHCLPLASEFDVYSGFKISRIVNLDKDNHKKNKNSTTPNPNLGGNSTIILHLHTAHALSIGLIAKWFIAIPLCINTFVIARKRSNEAIQDVKLRNMNNYYWIASSQAPRNDKWNCYNKDLRLIAVRRVDFSIKKRSLFKYNHKYLDALVCVSKNVYNVALNDGIDSDKLKVIHSGIDTKRYAIQNNNINNRDELLALYNIPKNHTIIGTVAALVGHKDYPTLLKAARIVSDKTENVTFIAIGDGKNRESLLKLHNDLELKNSFIFAGFQEDVKSHLHFFDIFVLSSKLEGLGTSVLDAMSAKKPIVACNGGGIPEMIKHEINGLLAEKENPEDLAEKILIMINNKEMRERLAKQAEIDVQEFSIENTVRKNIRLYEEFYGK